MRVLLTGSTGQLGGYLTAELSKQFKDVAAWSGSRALVQDGIRVTPVDLTQPDNVAEAFRQVRPAIVIHAAALSSIADCHRDPARAEAVNVRGTARLVDLIEEVKARLVYVSTDLVFDGEKGMYAELDPPNPLSAYGSSKASAERYVLQMRNAVVVRLSLLYGPTRIGRPTFFDQQIAAARNRMPIQLFEDEWRSPVDIPTASRALARLARSDYSGLLHVGGPQRMSRFEMGCRVANCLGLDPGFLVATRRLEVPFPEPRPRDCSLDSSRWHEVFSEVPWPDLEQATQSMLAP